MSIDYEMMNQWFETDFEFTKKDFRLLHRINFLIPMGIKDKIEEWLKVYNAARDARHRITASDLIRVGLYYVLTELDPHFVDLQITNKIGRPKTTAPKKRKVKKTYYFGEKRKQADELKRKKLEAWIEGKIK